MCTSEQITLVSPSSMLRVGWPQSRFAQCTAAFGRPPSRHLRELLPARQRISFRGALRPPSEALPGAIFQGETMGTFGEQLKQVLRRLRRAPMFTAITLVTLAVGIGANTAMFTVVEGVLLKPLPYPHPDTLVGVWHSAPRAQYGGTEHGAVELLHLSRAKSRCSRISASTRAIR